QLLPLIRRLLPDADAPTPVADKLYRFLDETLELVPEIGAVAGEARALTTRLSGGLAVWGRRITCEPQRLRVVGTAGSGKTQLALAVFRDALEAGRRPLYVCYNRPLADHLALIVPPGGEVATYHQLCDRILRGLGVPVDFSCPDVFSRLEHDFAAALPGEAWRFDTLIVDEGQDFLPEWRDPLLRLLTPTGQAWWLEDPMQNLYGRPPVPLPGWVTLRADANYRTPRNILDPLNRILARDRPLEAGSPLRGAELEILKYEGTQNLIEVTKRAITRALGLGFTRELIAVLTFRGREHSALSPFDRLGPHALRAFTGRYDLLGSPMYSEGETVMESVYRFKGQSAPCVILTEIDFDALDDLAMRKLFVGATRAMMKLTLIVSARADRLLQARLG
ncbi:MAG: ATP-dependent helicase, partial [Rhodocyclaceae bacterium]